MPRWLRSCTLVAVVATIAGTWSPAAAQRRPVAVIDLAGEPAVEQLAKALERELNAHPDLSQLPDSTLSAELIGQPADDDARRLADAAAALQRAEGDLEAFQFQSAAVHAAAAETALGEVTPRLAVPTFADLAFALGRIRLGEANAAAAAEQFALAHRLAPRRVLDPARLLPEEVAAFEAAKRAVAGTATVTVTGTGRLWLDGQEIGAPGAPVAVVPGLHVVALTGVERETRTRLVRAAPGTAQTLEIPDAPASDRLKVRRARLALRAVPDAAARSSAMAHLAGLLGVRDAVLLAMVDGTITVQTWRDRAPGFSPRTRLTTETPARLLEPLAPKRAPRLAGPLAPNRLPPVAPAAPWYRKRWVQGATLGIVVAVVGSILLVTAPDGFRQPADPELGFGELGRGRP